MSIKLEPVMRLVIDGRDLGVFTEQELLNLRDNIDRLFGLDRLLSREGFEVHTTVEAFSHVTGVNWVALKGRAKTEPILFHRQMAMEIVRQVCPQASLAAIGRAFGDREAGTVLYNQKAIDDRCKSNAKDRADFERIRAAVIEHVQRHASAQTKVINISGTNAKAAV
jgi:hypothetical protein